MRRDSIHAVAVGIGIEINPKPINIRSVIYGDAKIIDRAVRKIVCRRTVPCELKVVVKGHYIDEKTMYGLIEATKRTTQICNSITLVPKCLAQPVRHLAGDF